MRVPTNLLMKGVILMAKMIKVMTMIAVLVAALAIPTTASAAWTNLGGDPLFKGGIQGTGQTARNDFVRKMNTDRANKAMKRAGLGSVERRTVRSAVNKGKFRKCTLHYGDRFQRMSFGAGTIFVDRNVTFADPRYKSSGSPAFCLTVKVKKKGGKVTTIKIKVPFKCFNIAVVSKKTTKKPKKKVKKVVTPKIVCSNGVTVNSITACQTQVVTQKCEAGTIQSGNQCVVVQNNCGNVDVGGEGNTQGGNCNIIVPPPPTCPDGRPVPSNGDCDRPPQGDLLKPMHLSANGGNTYAYLKAYDPDGDPISAVIEASGGATTGPTVSWASYYDGISDTWAPCPAGWQCFRAKVTAGNYPAGTIANLSATVTAGGKTITLTNTTFPFLPDNGGF